MSPALQQPMSVDAIVSFTPATQAAPATGTLRIPVTCAERYFLNPREHNAFLQRAMKGEKRDAYVCFSINDGFVEAKGIGLSVTEADNASNMPPGAYVALSPAAYMDLERRAQTRLFAAILQPV